MTTTHLINLLRSRVLGFKTPFEHLSHIFPSSKHFGSLLPKVLGAFPSVIFIEKEYQNLILELSSSCSLVCFFFFDKCMFLGYSPTQKGYKCFHPLIRKFYVTMDVNFVKNQPDFSHTYLEEEN